LTNCAFERKSPNADIRARAVQTWLLAIEHN
jgi:hypothetical protein